jgi:tRNA modification GTPase
VSTLATIVAVSTPPGRGAIGIVRLSGANAWPIASLLLSFPSRPEHALARLASIFDPANPSQPLDQAVFTMFHGPRSYTGEDVVEIATHGAPVVLGAVVEGALQAGQQLGVGIRLAEPGEFTQRAFLAGKLDLTQAEAVHDLIAARTLEQARTAAQQLGGALSRRVVPHKERLIQLIALLEAGMDFASGELDDVDVVPPQQIAAAIAAAREPLQSLAASFRRGRLEREGATVALVGQPNAGKSSLFNRLLNRNRSIVTASPGTTRDTVEETAGIHGIPVRFIDTAGLRDAHPGHSIHEAEFLGIERSREALADADLVLFVHDATEPMAEEEHTLLATLAARPHLCIENKADLLDGALPGAANDVALRVSARSGDGLDALRDAIVRELSAGAVAETGALNSLRQQQTVLGAIAALEAAEAANTSGLPHEVLLMDLNRALGELDALTGQTTTDDILGRIFSTFCIGK